MKRVGTHASGVPGVDFDRSFDSTPEACVPPGRYRSRYWLRVPFIRLMPTLSKVPVFESAQLEQHAKINLCW